MLLKYVDYESDINSIRVKVLKLLFLDNWFNVYISMTEIVSDKFVYI